MVDSATAQPVSQLAERMLRGRQVEELARELSSEA
jgi:hypothetical protein